MAEKEVPTNEEIRKRAYELYLLRDRENGKELDDWFAAEQQLILKEEKRRNSVFAALQ